MDCRIFLIRHELGLGRAGRKLIGRSELAQNYLHYLSDSATAFKAVSVKMSFVSHIML